jgi:O-antigen/teichoic acid export membrane protein
MGADSLLVSGSTLGCQALGVATSLLLRFALDPAQMGVWQALKMFLNYANYANLGVSKGAARELTVALGRGDAASARQGLDLAFTVNTLSSMVYGALLAAAGLWIGVSSGDLGRNAWTFGLLALSVLVVVQRHVTFHVTILRCRQAFAVTSQLSLLEAALTLCVAGCSAWLWGLPGLCGGTLLVLIASLIYLKARGAEPFAWAWNAREISRLIGMGGPILLAGAATVLLQSIDKLMILACSSDREFELGCYSLSLLVSGQLCGLANMLSLVMGPRYAELFGHGGRRDRVALLAARASELQACLLALPAGLAIVVAVPVLGRLFPAYRLGVTPALWLVPGAVALGLSLPANQYLVAVYRERRALAAALTGVSLAAAGNYLALAAGYGLDGVAVSTSCAYLAYLAIMASISLWPQLDARGRLRYLLGMAATLAPVLGVAAGLEWIWPSDGASLGGVMVKAVLVLAAWAGAASIGWRYGGWRETWREERRR